MTEEWQYSKDLVTTVSECEECLCTLVLSDNEPAEITIYTRQGTLFSQHFTKECPNRWCRRRYHFGYSTKEDTKLYDRITSEKKYLITSNETAFAVDYLYENTLHMLYSNATVQGLTDVYNNFHNYDPKKKITRKDLIPKRLASAFYLYGILEFGDMHNIDRTMKTNNNNWLDEYILEQYPSLKSSFSNVWCASHQCKVENCEGMMISDGGMKIYR